MKRLLNKLRSKAGESLVEVLCAILIFTMASVGMYSMVMAANNINATAKEADKKFQENMLIVEKGDATNEANHKEGTITVSYKVGEEYHKFEIPVDVYKSGDLFSYFKAEPAPTQGGAE